MRKILAEMKYELGTINKGYANKTLYVNVGENGLETRQVTADMKDIFIGGKGFDLWLMWNGVTGNTRWDSPENEICIAAGPLGGTTIYPGGGKSIVTTISPLTGIPIDSNVGGYFGPLLKFSGFDAIEVQGKAKKDVIVYIDGVEGLVQIVDAGKLPDESQLICAQLTEEYGRGNPRSISVVASGPGAKHSYLGCLNFSWYDTGRKMVRFKQAGRGGIGSVFRNKNLKALVVRGPRISTDSNAPAHRERLMAVGKKHSREIRELDSKQNEMAVVGTTHLVPIMNDYDLLPTNNFQYGSHPDASAFGAEVFRKRFHKGFDGCWIGCPVACAHGVKDYVPRTGPFAGKKVFVDGPEYETVAGCGSNCGIFDADHVIEMNFYCDIYGVDTISVGTAMAFVMECFERGLITSTITGGLEMTFGNKDAALELLHQMARGEGFGLIFGKGIRQMKSYFAEHFASDKALMEDIGMESKGLEYSEYVTKESLAQQGGYGLTLKGPQHDEAWLIFLDMVHNYMPTFEQKAEALHWFPMWRTWFGLTGLCKLPWNDITPVDNKDTEEPAKVMKHVGWYAEFFSSVTGREVGADDLNFMSEKVYNFQRVFNLKMGKGKRENDTIPYRSMGPVTNREYESREDRYDEKLKAIGYDVEGKNTNQKRLALRAHREEQYEILKDAVYKRRGWTKEGVPTLEKVRELGIDFPDVVELLSKHQ